MRHLGLTGVIVVCCAPASCASENAPATEAAPALERANRQDAAPSRQAAVVGDAAPHAPVPLPEAGFDYAAVFGQPPGAARRLWGNPIKSQPNGDQTLVSWKPAGYRVGVFYDSNRATAITVGLPGVCAARRELTEDDRAQVSAWSGWPGPRCVATGSAPDRVLRFELYACGFRIDSVARDICAR